ncbi:unnamed protein product [Phytomonas sp. EM1]|nr:unnamed protein product [Phytomonas sp. EM1]|eukprot:CCW62774.1 unnamed protein product [Phytomonas sp. isolate EM1]
MERILDFSQPLDVELFDSVVLKLASGSPVEIMDAQEVLTRFKQTPDAFFRVDKLLSKSKNMSTKFFALQILEDTILQRWNSLDAANQSAVRGFVLSLILQECASLDNIRRNRALLTKLNTTLVSIAKREWPVRWPSFIQDIAGSARYDEPMVENNLNLFRLIGEEIFEFGAKTLTSRWVERKKAALADDFRYIMDVCGEVLLRSEDTALLKTALETLAVYVPWMSPMLTIQEAILGRLTCLMVGDEQVRTAAVRCFTEICTVKPEKGAQGDLQTKMILQAFEAAMSYIVTALPTSHSSIIERTVQLYEQGNSVDQNFVSNLGLLIAAFLRNYYANISYNDELLVTAHEFLVGISNIDDKEMFKSCVEYWFWLGEKLLSMTSFTLKRNLTTKLKRLFTDVRYVLIKRMAKPEEVILVEEDGELRRERIADVEEVEQYHLMSQTLILYTNLDSKDTRDILVNLMKRQLDRSEWSWHNCNTLSWALGSIAGVLPEDEEAELFMTMIKDLLVLCKEMQGKENRAVIASDIMFVASRYKTFMQKRPRFMFTVARKVFEFMSETFPGVQDMAVDTFYKLAEQLAPLFVEKMDDVPSFAESIAAQWSTITSLLSSQQVQVCFSAVGFMIAADKPDHQAKLLSMFLEPTNTHFNNTMGVVKGVDYFCQDHAIMMDLLYSLRIFSSVASTCGDAFIFQMNVILQNLYYLYNAISAAQNAAITREGVAAISTESYKYMRLTKREIILIFERFVAHSAHLDFIATNIMPDVLTVVLVDYQNSIPQLREAGALALVTACVQTLSQLIASDCGAILDVVFNTTVSMITDNMESYPDFRVNLFKLLGAFTDKCFESFVTYASNHSDILEGMLWAIRHRDYPTMSTGLQTLDHFLETIVHYPLAEAFYNAFLHRIFEEVLHAAMDFFHAAGFPFHCSILRRLFAVTEMVPRETPVLGRDAVTAYLADLLLVIPTITKPTVLDFVDRCYDAYKKEAAFETVLSDFLIEVQVWGAEAENRLQEAEERRRREETIPGFSTLSTNEPINPFLETGNRLQQNQTRADALMNTTSK